MSSLHSNPDPDFDARWSAWVARSEAHERAVRRRFVIALPFAVVFAAVACALLVR
jgi:hypothetical protein